MLLAQGSPLGSGIEAFFIDFIVAPVSLMVFGCMIVSPFIARSKGYAPYYWFLALHPVGLIVIANLAALSTASTPEKYEGMQARANLIGGILTGIALFFSTALIGLLVLRWL